MKDKRDIKVAADMSWLMWYLSGVVINNQQLACIFTDHEKAQKGISSSSGATRKTCSMGSAMGVRG